MHFKNMKIGVRLGVAFAAVLTLTVLLALIGITRLQDVNSATERMDSAIRKVRLSEKWYAGNIANDALGEARLRATDPADDAQLLARMKQRSAEITKIQDELKPLVSSEKGKQLMGATAEKRQVYIDARNQVFAMRDDPAKDPAAFKAFIEGKMRPAMTAYDDSVAEVVAWQERLFNEAKGDVDAATASGERFLMICGAAALAIGALLAWLLTRSITVPLRDAVAVARTVAAGDLSRTVTVSSKDETGELMAALKEMSDRLNQIVGRVRTGADAIAAASTEVASGNQDLSGRTEEQASSLEETAASIEELTTTVQQNAENARHGNQLAASASDVASRGGAVVSQVVDTMEAIHASASKIVDIIGVIDG
ncbi:HAMP domain-containing protein, partial [Oxalobacteraceae bacterium OM1]